MIPFDFTRPWGLLALLALVPVIYLARSTRLRLVPGRFWTSSVLRAVAVISLAFAVAGLRQVRLSDELAVIFVIDRSRSVTTEDEARALAWVQETAREAGRRESVGLVVFGKEASVEVSPAPRLNLDKVHSVISPESTDIARALRLAAAACPEWAQKRIVLLSDGNENSGDAAAEALAARARGAEVWTAALGRESRAEVRVDRVLSPTRVSPKEPYELTAIVTASDETEAVFRIVKNRVPLAPVKRTVKKGTWPQTFALKATEEEAGGALDFEVFIEVPDGRDSWRENNVGRAHTRVSGPSRVLFLAGKDGEADALAGCLRDAGIDVEVRGPAGFPLSLAEMDAFDAILMCDIHSRQLSKAQHEAIRQYVHDLGGGFAMIGGDASFGSGAWQRTAVETCLPVDMDVRQLKRLASLAMAIAIDSSGSMSARVSDGRTKLELAGEGATECLRVLNERDQIAVCTTDTATTWLIPLQQIDDREGIEATIMSLQQGGGGIYCATAIRDMFEELSTATAQARHAILFADAADAEEHEGVEEMIRLAGAEGITLSVVAIGQPTDGDAAWLESIAALGGGRYYITDDPMDLPRLFSEETVTAARSTIIEREFTPTITRPAQFMEGVKWDSTPSLLGWVSTVPKPTAEVHLEAEENDPLLAKWHYGLGRSIAWTSDATSRWSANWVGWPGYRTLWPQMVRWLLRKQQSDAYSVATSLTSNGAHLSVDAVGSDGRFRDFLKLRAFVAGPAGSLEVPVRQTGPGRYEVDVPATQSGSWFVTIAEEEGGEWAPKASIPILIPYPAEFRATSPNHALLKRLAELTGGRPILLEKQPDLFRHTAAPARVPQELWRFLLILALSCLFLDVAARRLGIPDAWLRKRIKAVVTEADAVVERLRSAKAHALPVAAREPAPPAAESPTGFRAPEIELPAELPKPAEPAPPVAEGGYLDRLKEAKKRAQK
ncbi:MAG: FixH family protein [Planctomycetota bacterium]